MNRLGGRISLFEMDEIEGLDIDTELDITIAESALRATPVFPASNHLDVND
jgi:N-acylneuraminate cytidylyltransferase